MPELQIVGHTNFDRRYTDIPRLFIAMDNFGLPRSQLGDLLRQKKVVLLLRDPRDVAVSWYFHLSKRSTDPERCLFQVPDDVEARGPYDLALNPAYGMPAVIDFMNFWSGAMRTHSGAIMMKYEDLRRDPERTFTPVMKLLQPDVTGDEIRDAIEFADFSWMKSREERGMFGASILQPGKMGDGDSFKVRRGKVAGYVDYFPPDQRSVLDDMVKEMLDPELGYS